LESVGLIPRQPPCWCPAPQDGDKITARAEFLLVQGAELRQKTRIQIPLMFSLVHKRLSQIDRNCSKVHGYLIKFSMRKLKEKPLSKESERKLQKMIAAITEARDMLNDLLEESEKN
jgi:hypothetical protein